MKKILPFILVIGGLSMAFIKPLLGLFTPAVLEIRISNPPVIMSSIYKVYANEAAFEGKYSLFKMLIKNSSDVSAKNIEISYNVSNYIDWVIIEKIPLILPGQTVVVNCYPKFPDKIIEKTTDSKETVKLAVKGTNVKTIENSFSISVKGRNDFMYNFLPADEIRTAEDYYDNVPLLSCLVTPNDPLIKYLTQQIQEKVLKGETAGVSKNEAECIRFLKGIYTATLLSHVVYSGTTGVPSSIDDFNSIVQTIKLPREVITGKTGLCIELSILYASIMASAGMDPVIYLIPGHAYPGFKLNNEYYAIESTAIGGEGIGGSKTADQAFDMAMNNKTSFIQKMEEGDERYLFLDIREAVKNGAVALELKDDNFLRQKIDEMAASFNGQTVKPLASNIQPDSSQNVAKAAVPETGSAVISGNVVKIPEGYKTFNDAVVFGYPADWKAIPANQYVMQQCKYIIANSANSATIEVYNFPGYTNPKQALTAINEWQKTFGFNLTYKQLGQENGYTLFKGSTGSRGNIAVNWVAAFKVSGSSVSGIIAGANAFTGSKHEQTLLNILNTLQ